MEHPTAQHRKPDVQAAILDAAARVFSREGPQNATMAGIAKAAGLSVGNLYRYHPGKQELLQAVLPDDWCEAFFALLRRRQATLDNVRDVRGLPPAAPFFAVSEELLSFFLRHRLRVVILLGRSQGTPYERHASALIEDLCERTCSHFEALRPGRAGIPSERTMLRRIYRNLLEALVETLAQDGEEARIRADVACFTRYHLAGLNAFFEEEWP